jgi:hypothetical protein
MWFRESPAFWRNLLPPSSGLKSKLSKKPAVAGGRLNLPFSVILKIGS